MSTTPTNLTRDAPPERPTNQGVRDVRAALLYFLAAIGPAAS
jgi:hypothetical protein